MSFTKLTRAEILEVRSSPTKVAGANLQKFADFSDYKTDDGYIYTRVRAISSRVNKNYDGWPSEQLAGSYRTFLGKPIFVDHHNSDPSKARGVVVDARLHIEDDMQKAAALDPYYSTAPDNHKPPTWVELLLETDAKAFPRLAKAIVSGDIDSVSMGCNVDRSCCSICSNWASTPDDYCQHVRLKGAHFDSHDEKGNRISKLAYEDCYDIAFFEISYVFDPADETALVHEVKTAGVNVDFSDDPDYEDLLKKHGWQKAMLSQLPGGSADEAAQTGDRPVWVGPTGWYDNVDDAVQSLQHAAMVKRSLDADTVDRIAGVMGVAAASVPMLLQLLGPEKTEHLIQLVTRQAPSPEDPQQDIEKTADYPPTSIRGVSPEQFNEEQFRRMEEENKENEESDEWQRHRPQPDPDQPDPTTLDWYEYEQQHAGRPPVEEDARAGVDHPPYPRAPRGQQDVRDRELAQRFNDPVQQQEMFNKLWSTPHSDQLEEIRNLPEVRSALKKLAENPLPQSMQTVAPTHVNTLRQEKMCPVCGEGMEDGVCGVCNYEEPPEGFDNPDLSKAQQVNDLMDQKAAPPAGGPEAGAPDMGGAMPPDAGQMTAPSGPPAPGTMASVSTSAVTDDWKVVIRSRTAAQINKIERPLLSPKTVTSDLPKNPNTIRDSAKPVKSNTNESKMKKTTTDAIVQEMVNSGLVESPEEAAQVLTGGKDAVTAFLTRAAQRHAADAASDPAEFANSNLEQVGGEYGNPEAGVTHENVEKVVDIEGTPTATWAEHGDALGQHAPVTPGNGSAGQGPIGAPLASTKQAGGFPDHEPSHVNLDAPLKEEVGPPTSTWGSDAFHITEPVTQGENGNQVGGPIGQPMAKVHDSKAHMLKAMKLAEVEVGLGLIDPEQKFNRAEELDQEAPEQLDTRLDAYSRVKQAGLTKRAKVATAGRLPSLAARSAVAAKNDDDETTQDGILFR